MRKKWWLLGLFIALLVVIGAAYHHHEEAQPVSGVPTVFVHGYNGTAGSTNRMIAALAHTGIAKRTMRVTVKANGDLTVDGGLYGKNPIVQVVYQNRTNGPQFTNWLLKVYAMLHSRYHVQRVNAVGHSAGAISVVEAAMQHPAVKMNKIVAIAGPFNGFFEKGVSRSAFNLAANGQPKSPSERYRRLVAEAPNFRANAVLNIYGNLGDGSDSDGVVPVNSARSMKYLLRNWHGSYQERQARGQSAQHSRLHQNNRTVDTALREFLF